MAAHPPVPDRVIRTAADRAALAAGCWFDQAAANRVRDFFRQFVRITVGQSLRPFDLLPWQWEGITEPLFGWKRPDGLRRFRRAYLSTPKKNGKSAFLSGVALYLLLADGERGSQVYSAAADKVQAGIIFDESAQMVRASPGLAGCLRLLDSTKTMISLRDGSRYRALSREARTKEGFNAHGILFDELHAQAGRELWDCLRYAGAARRQPLHLSITTAGGDLETICGEQYRYAKSILSGENTEDHQFFAYIAEASLKDDWTDERVWFKANPSLGVTIQLDDFRNDFLEARESPAKENSFRRYRLNQWVQTADAWLSMDQWDQCERKINPDEFRGRKCYAGLDLSATDDTTALVLMFPDGAGGVDILCWFWLPRENIGQLERKHKAPYTTWERAGLFTLTDGNVVDYDQIRARVRELAGIYQIEELSIDRKFQGQALETDLIEDGIAVAPSGQGWVSQDVPAKELERLLKARLFHHGGHPVMRWHASNVVVDIDKNGNYSINKKRSRSKIDGIAATLMALYSLLKAGGLRVPTYYAAENPGLVLL